MNILVTGGAGFIGSALIRHLISSTGHRVLNLDKLTYAGRLASLNQVVDCERYHFVQGDICDQELLAGLFRRFRPDAVMHLAAESHVDRSIDGSAAFVETNIIGTYRMLEAALEYWRWLASNPDSAPPASSFRFHHISTDEVYGSLGPVGFFTEQTAYDPRSPYSASKASADHLAMAWYHTYGLPVVITNCSNNYGPYQFPEKLIPLVLLNALELKPLPIYGRGDNVRDWLYVEDHVRALLQALTAGEAGQSYNIGGGCELTNLQVAEKICDILDQVQPRPLAGGLRQTGSSASYRDLITFVADRPGHDQRYAIDAARARDELGWVPRETFDSGLAKTVQWYLANSWWWAPLRAEGHGHSRLGQKD